MVQEAWENVEKTILYNVPVQPGSMADLRASVADRPLSLAHVDELVGSFQHSGTFNENIHGVVWMETQEDKNQWTQIYKEVMTISEGHRDLNTVRKGRDQLVRLIQQKVATSIELYIGNHTCRALAILWRKFPKNPKFSTTVIKSLTFLEYNTNNRTAIRTIGRAENESAKIQRRCQFHELIWNMHTQWKPDLDLLSNDATAKAKLFETCISSYVSISNPKTGKGTKKSPAAGTFSVSTIKSMWSIVAKHDDELFNAFYRLMDPALLPGYDVPFQSMYRLDTTLKIPKDVLLQWLNAMYVDITKRGKPSAHVFQKFVQQCRKYKAIQNGRNCVIDLAVQKGVIADGNREGKWEEIVRLIPKLGNEAWWDTYADQHASLSKKAGMLQGSKTQVLLWIDEYRHLKEQIAVRVSASQQQEV